MNITKNNKNGHLLEINNYFDDILDSQLLSIDSLIFPKKLKSSLEIKKTFTEFINKIIIPNQFELLKNIKNILIFKNDINIFDKHIFNECTNIPSMDDIKKIFIDETNKYMILENIIYNNSTDDITNYYLSLEYQLRASFYNICPNIYYLIINKTNTITHYYRVQDYVNISNNLYNIIWHISTKKINNYINDIMNYIHILINNCKICLPKLNIKSFICWKEHKLVIYKLDDPCPVINDNYVYDFVYSATCYFKSIINELNIDSNITHNIIKKQQVTKIIKIFLLTFYEYIIIHNINIQLDLQLPITIDNILFLFINVIFNNKLITKNDLTELESNNIVCEYVYNYEKLFIKIINDKLNYYKNISVDKKIVQIVVPHFIMLILNIYQIII